MIQTSAHQRKIRDDLAVLEPRVVPSSLDGFTVRVISKSDAVPLIVRYEWLGDLGMATAFIGLFCPHQTMYGAACFGYGPASPIMRELLGGEAWCLERGACVHYAPPNSASFLITKACKLMMKETGVSRFFAYADPNAGEYGAVYQASNWTYLGQGLNGGVKGRKKRDFVLAPGAEDKPQNWRGTRDLRRGGRHLGYAEARALGWRIESRPAKHVYATNVGPDRRKWLKTTKSLPYPSPNPELKRDIAARAGADNAAPLPARGSSLRAFLDN